MKSFTTACLPLNSREYCTSKCSAFCSGLDVLVLMTCAGSRVIKITFLILSCRR